MIDASKKIEIAKWLLDSEGAQQLTDDLGQLESWLHEMGLWKIYDKIELPLVEVLARMHKRGILVDRKVLAELGEDLGRELGLLAKKIYGVTGKIFNINSPKQIGEILFDVLKIKSKGRKTKGGARSTNVESLEVIKGEHEVVSLILKYRELFKLQSTYVLPLSELAVDSIDGRIRTTFLQTATATGRLSSENPNLQNVPIGTELASKLRSAFIPAPLHVFLSLDYSQIELRVMASVSGDAKMIEAFQNDLDIHKLTASNVFNVPLEEVTKEQRQMAKTLNFGVIYGMGPQAFARSAGVSFDEAQKFIDEYFHDFADIKVWQNKTISAAMQMGYVETLNGRKRWLPNLISDSPRSMNEAVRAAINMPIQGLAADIIKIAMIRVASEAPEAKLILTIHDELVFEVPDDMLKGTAEKIRKIMESAYELKVPLNVDVAMGKNWAEIS